MCAESKEIPELNRRLQMHLRHQPKLTGHDTHNDHSQSSVDASTSIALSTVDTAGDDNYNDFSALEDNDANDDRESLAAPQTVSMMNDFSDIEAQTSHTTEAVFMNNLSDIEMPTPSVTKQEEKPITSNATTVSDRVSAAVPVTSTPLVSFMPPLSTPTPVSSSSLSNDVFPIVSSSNSLPKVLPTVSSSLPTLSLPTSSYTQPLMSSTMSLPNTTGSSQEVPISSTSTPRETTPVPSSLDSRLSPLNRLSSTDDTVADVSITAGNEDFIVNDLGGNLVPTPAVPLPPPPPQPVETVNPISSGATPSDSGRVSPRTANAIKLLEMHDSGTDTDNPFEPRPKTPPPLPPPSHAPPSSSSELGSLVRPDMWLLVEEIALLL